MTHKIYTFDVTLEAGARQDMPEPDGWAPVASMVVNIEADRLDAATERAEAVGEEFLLEHDEMVFESDGEHWWKFNEGHFTFSGGETKVVDIGYDDSEPASYYVARVNVEFSDLTAAAVAPLAPDVRAARFCPEHGRKDSWVVRGGNRYCSDCDRRLVDLKESVMEEMADG